MVELTLHHSARGTHPIWPKRHSFSRNERLGIMSLPFGIVDIGLAAAKPEETPENGECAFHAIASGLPNACRHQAAAYLRRLVVRGMTTRAVWKHMQSIGGGLGLVAAHQSAVLDNSVHLGHPPNHNSIPNVRNLVPKRHAHYRQHILSPV